jgi:Fur family ferric uptake transcriptional regulator
VLGAVRERPHATVEEIAAGARERAGTVSIQAVYDVLRALAKAGLAHGGSSPPAAPRATRRASATTTTISSAASAATSPTSTAPSATRRA